MFQIKLIKVGKILKERGLKGELKVHPFTDDLEKFKKYKLFFIDDICFEVEYYKSLNRFLIVKLKGIDVVHVASEYRNKYIAIDKSALPVGDILIDDYLGMKVVDESSKSELGYISSYVVAERSDLFEITLVGEKKRFIPASLDFVSVPDFANNIVYLQNCDDLI